MKRIWKWNLRVEDLQEYKMHEGAELLTVQAQGDEIQLWALVDPNARHVFRRIATYGTGYPVPDVSQKYVGTYQLHGGALVFHVFDLGESGWPSD
jgi:hypothetical protein